MRKSTVYLFLLLVSSSLQAQFEKTIHKTFEVGDANEIVLDFVDEYEVELWAGDLILVETNVKLSDASPNIFNHYLKKKKRYEIKSEHTGESLQLSSENKERKLIRTPRGECLEIITITLLVPDVFELADETHLYRVEEEEVPVEQFVARGGKATTPKTKAKEELATTTKEETTAVVLATESIATKIEKAVADTTSTESVAPLVNAANAKAPTLVPPTDAPKVPATDKKDKTPQTDKLIDEKEAISKDVSKKADEKVVKESADPKEKTAPSETEKETPLVKEDQKAPSDTIQISSNVKKKKWWKKKRKKNKKESN